MHINDIAEICHEANRVYCTTIGDHTQTDWFDAPQWQKDSAVLGVEFHIDNPDADDAASHNSWLAQKDAEGWVYGPVKDPSTKQHPCCVPFNELPVEQQVKDALFRAICGALIPNLSVVSDTVA